MGLLDSAGSALDAASSILGGPAKGGAAAAPDVTPVFTNGENLGVPPADIGGAQPPNDETVHDHGAPIEFIHFGIVHPDASVNFAHPSIPDDTQTPKLGDGPGSRAIMFRDALEREVILLGGFINSCQCVLKEKEASEGGVGQALAVVSSLVGGGGGGDSGPKAADLNSIFSTAQGAVTPINISPVHYKLVHQAGIDLQKARQQYQAFRDKLLVDSGGGGGGGLLSQVSAIAGSLGPIGDIVNTIQGIAFKAFDVYVRSFANISKLREGVIEKACHDMTLTAIKGDASQDTATPIFPVWFPKPQDQQQAASSSPSDGGPLGDAEREVSDMEQKGEKAAKDVKDFLFGDPVDCPGTPFLAQAFSVDFNQNDQGQPVTDQPPQPPQDPGAPVLDAFRHVVNKDNPLPGFVETVIKEIMQLNTDFVQAVYEKLMEREPNATIDESALYEAGRKRLLQRLVGLLLDQVQFLKRLVTSPLMVQNMAVGPGHFMDEGLDLLNQKLGSKLDVVLHLTMHELADQLQGARKNAVSNKSLTMEAYLGAMPYLLALLFRDTFFPVWDILVKEVFGTIGGPVGSAVNTALDAMKRVKSVTDTARDWKKRGEALPGVAQDAAKRHGSNTANLLDPASIARDQGGKASQDQDEFNQALGQQADRGSGSWGGDGSKAPDSPPFPISGRVPSAQGVDIQCAEWKEVLNNLQYVPKLDTPSCNG